MAKLKKGNSLWLIGLLLLVLIIGYCRKNSNPSASNNRPNSRNKTDYSSATNSHQSIINPNTTLSFTKHAKCRMACRDIGENEIREVLREGHINYQKSKNNDGPCPTYAIEDKVKNVNLRIVFGVCDNVVKVITCIDLDNEHDCNCK